jgi:hypothetical protein
MEAYLVSLWWATYSPRLAHSTTPANGWSCKDYKKSHTEYDCDHSQASPLVLVALSRRIRCKAMLHVSDAAQLRVKTISRSR